MNQMPSCETCRKFYVANRELLVRIMNEIAEDEKKKSARRVEYGDRVMLTREITRGDLISAYIEQYHNNDHSVIIDGIDDA